ncbi:cytochrome C assembly family protein [Alkalibacillus haloalkaliphilus]|uniref:cytochrome C assembly family protein n=1 Tax=Alkalibacillus haloalkaliphilus TaxID=94136 RepID=UPI0029369821|nr:cytochrome c biogenesis protein CcsA [Alkalibacillus haloalkaliphilus]MDV2581136.1 cytochrome c biogenesis protein CcsA [Alkalibacillus haloalkaliphilus]
MGIFEQFKLYELIVILYGLSVTFYFYDFVERNRKANKIAFWLLLLVWILQTVLLFTNIYIHGFIPVFSILEGLYFYAWLILLVSIVVNYFYKMDLVVFIVNIIGFLVMMMFLMSYATSDQSQLTGNFVGEILVAHIVLAFVAYTLYTLSFAFATLYLIQFYLLKKKRWRQLVKRIGNLEQLEKILFLLVVFATPILLISLVLGLLWAYTTDDLFYWLDAKTVGSFVVIGIYSTIIYIRVTKKLVGKSVARLNIIAFLVLFSNYLILSMLSNFHGLN